MTVKRIWHGWTKPGNAEAYRQILHRQVLPGIEAKRIPGYIGLELLSRDLGHEVEFMTIITFESLSDVIAFQGEDYARAYIPEAAREVLSRWDEVCLKKTVPGTHTPV